MWHGIIVLCCMWSAFLLHETLQQEINIGEATTYNIDTVMYMYIHRYLVSCYVIPPSPAGAFFYDNELELEKEFLAVVNSINGPEAEQTLRFNPLIKRLKPEDGSVILQEYGAYFQPFPNKYMKKLIKHTKNTEKLTSLSACDLIDNGVAAIFGPSSQSASGEYRGEG